MAFRNLLIAVGAAVLGLAVSVQSASAQERLIFASLSPGGSLNSKYYNAWAERINEAGSGAVEVVVRDGTTIANFGNVYDRVQKDVIQIGWALHSVLGGKFPLTDVTQLPFVAEDNEYCSVALWRLYESGLLDDEYRDIVPLAFPCLTAGHLHWAEKPDTVETLSGAKFRVTGKLSGQIVEILGGTPIALRGGEMYEGLQRGTIEGASTSWSAFVPYNLWEVTKFHMEAPLGTSPSMYFMSKKKWDGLSKKAQEAIRAHTGEDFTRQTGKFFAGQAELGRKKALDMGHEVVELSPELRAKWQKLMEPVLADWAGSRENGGRAIETYRKIYADVAAGR